MANRQPLRNAGLLLGLGLGGLVDGILLHQILQWHHLFSHRRPVRTLADMHFNMLGDGLFDALCWLLVVAGVIALWRAAELQVWPWSRRYFGGWILFGFGAFNLGEGLINHHLLELHHVRPGPGMLWWDLAFLASGVLLLGTGFLLQQQVPREKAG